VLQLLLVEEVQALQLLSVEGVLLLEEEQQGEAVPLHQLLQKDHSQLSP